MSKTSEIEIRVRYQETDQMGIVYHANYFVWFEIGRTEWFRSLGFSYKEMEKMGIKMPVTSIDCRYLESAHYDDICTIRTSIESFSSVKLLFSYQIIRKSDGHVLAAGKSQHC